MVDTNVQKSSYYYYSFVLFMLHFLLLVLLLIISIIVDVCDRITRTYTLLVEQSLLAKIGHLYFLCCL